MRMRLYVVCGLLWCDTPSRHIAVAQHCGGAALLLPAAQLKNLYATPLWPLVQYENM
jgi:hypothetical protein